VEVNDSNNGDNLNCAGLCFPQFTGKKDICTETAFSLILGRAALRGTGAHHLKGDATGAAEAARMRPRTNLTPDSGCHCRLSGIFPKSLKKDAGQAGMTRMEKR